MYSIYVYIPISIHISQQFTIPFPFAMNFTSYTEYSEHIRTHTQSQSLFKCCSGPRRQTITNNITNNIYRNKPTTSFCHLHILLRADCCVHVRANSLRLRMKQEMCTRCETTLEIESILCCSAPLNLSLFSFLCICTAGQEKCSCW